MLVDNASFNGELLMGQLSGFRGAPAGYAVERSYFVYQVPVFAALAAASAAGSTGNNQLQIQADSDFEWCESVFQFDLALATYTWATANIPNMTIQIADSGSQQFMFSAAVPVPSVFGPIHYPKRLPITKVFKASTNITFTAQNIDAAVANGNLRLSLIGWKLKYYPTGGAGAEQLPQQA